MQEIFYNGNIVTNNEKKETMPAMMINEGSVFFVGEESEVLNLKTDEVQPVDLKKKYVYPTLFDIHTNVFSQIDKKLKSAKKLKKIQFSDDIDENYENFENFEEYKAEYLKIEKQYIKNGISTICERNIDKHAFAFWKKMAEEKLLSIDIAGYVDIIGSKQVMDDNCVTYRKYKNRFRLAGYNIKIDERVQELKAWLTKPYAGTKSHYGAGEFYGEHLYYILKMALEERKQVLYEVYGDKSLNEVLTVLSEIEVKEKISDFYRPLFYGANVLTKKLISKIKHFDGTLIFEEYDKLETKQIKKYLGCFRFRKCYHNYKLLTRLGVRFIILNKQCDYQNFSSRLNLCLGKKEILRRFDANIKFKKNLENFIFNQLYVYPAYACFDQDTKACLETQMTANFVVFDGGIFDNKPKIEKNIKSVYIKGEKKY